MGRRLGCRLRRRRGRRARNGLQWRRRRSARREQRQWIDVALRIIGHANAEVDVWNIVLARAAWPNGRDDGALADDVAFAHCHRAEVDERHRIPAGRLHRDHLPVRADRSREGDDAGGRGEDGPLALSRHVDPPVLAARVGIPAEDEWADHFSRRRPGPRRSGSWAQ